MEHSNSNSNSNSQHSPATNDYFYERDAYHNDSSFDSSDNYYYESKKQSVWADERYTNSQSYLANAVPVPQMFERYNNGHTNSHHHHRKEGRKYRLYHQG